MDYLHPMVVHFPVALLMGSVLFDLLASWLQNPGLRSAAKYCLWAGIVTGFAAVQTGEMAEEALEHGAVLHELIEEHEHWAKRGLIAFVVLAVLRAWHGAKSQLEDLPLWYFIGALAAAVVLGRGAHLGGQMVYEHGAGVKASTADTHSHSHEKKHVHDH